MPVDTPLGINDTVPDEKESVPVSSRTPEIDIEQLDRARSGDATVIDVREPGEYVTGHVPGAALVPMIELSFRLGELDKTRPVYVLCASGNRSAAMTDVLVAAGYDAYSVTGGTAAWARSGRPLETGVPSTR
jgi:rhodanese-related sulfurtransferase